MLSGGSLVGHNVLQTLAGRRDGIVLAATNSVADAPRLFEFDKAFLVPRLSDVTPDVFAERFWQILEQLDPDLVIPCRDEDVAFLAEQALRHTDWQGRFLCGNADVAKAMLDKMDSATFSLRHRLPFAPTLDVADGIEAALVFVRDNGFPVIAKPRRGFASRGVRLLVDEEQVRNACMDPGYILQKYYGDAAPALCYIDDLAEKGIALFQSLEEVKLSLQACIARDGRVARWLATGNTMRQGRSEQVDRYDDAELLSLAHAWAGVFAAAGWRGPLNIQCQRASDGSLGIYEYNGRFTGATAARWLLGFDEVGWTLRDWLGIVLPVSSGHYETSESVVNLPYGQTVACEDADRLRRTGYWERS